MANIIKETYDSREHESATTRVIQITEDAPTLSDAEEMLYGLVDQEGFIGGRIYGCGHAWRVQAFVEDNPHAGNMWLPDGMRRVTAFNAFLQNLDVRNEDRGGTTYTLIGDRVRVRHGRTDYTIEYRRRGNDWRHWARVLYLPMALGIARRRAAELSRRGRS